MSIGRPKGGVNKKYTPEFKLEVINFNNVNGPAETLRAYGLPTDSIIYKWQKIYLEEGMEGLSVERRGKATKADNVMKGRPANFNAKKDEDLIAENRRLKMENDYLKKLAALIQEEEKRQKKSK